MPTLPAAPQPVGIGDDALRAALMRGFAPGRRRLIGYGVVLQLGGLALGVLPVLSADPELARATVVGKAALALLAGGLGLAGAALAFVGWAVPSARAEQVLDLVRAAPTALQQVGRLGHIRGALVPVDADDDAPQQLLLVTTKGLRLRVPMASADISAVLARLAADAPGVQVLGAS